MKVLLVSSFIPSSHNLNGPSALPYYLSKYCGSSISIDLACFENDQVNFMIDDLRKENIYNQIFLLKKTPKHKYYPLRLFQKAGVFHSLHHIYLNHLPGSDMNDLIKKKGYDVIWLYPHALYPWYRALSMFNIVVTGPDSAYLHAKVVEKAYSSKFSENSSKSFKSFAKLKKRACSIDSRWAKSRALIHVVGKDDLQTFKQLGAVSNSFFSRHPYSDYMPVKESLTEANGKLTVLITGANHSVYIGTLLDNIIKAISSKPYLKDYFVFSFIGKNFEESRKMLIDVGFSTYLTTWVESYDEALAGAHIQLFPISVGTGTKGKVLSALVAGLFCIGTKYAFENIDIDQETDCKVINTPEDVVACLEDISVNKAIYELKAKNACNKARDAHHQKLTAESFWSQVKGYFK